MNGLLARVVRALEHPLVVGLVLIALAAPAALSVLAPVENGDIAWHLALGRWIAQHGSIPFADPFSYTAAGAPMVAHEWLAQLLYWQWTTLVGLDGLRALHVAFAGATLGLAFLSFRAAGAPPSLALLATAAFSLFAAPRFQVRPHVLNPIFGITLFTLLFRSRAMLRPAGIALGAAMVGLWANLHSAAVLLPSLLWVWVGIDFVQRRVAPRPPWPDDPAGGSPRRGLAVAAACSLALLATPNHVRLFPYLIDSNRVNADMSTEWLSLPRIASTGEHTGLFVVWACLLAATGLTTALVLRERRSWAMPALALAGALAPLQSIRFIWLGFIPLGFVAGEVARWLGRLAPARRDAVLALCALAAVGLALTAHRPLIVRTPFFNPGAFPLRSVQLLHEVPLEGRGFARAEWGGFITLMLDEQVPIFADGRWVTLGRKIVRQAHVIATGRPRALVLLDQWNIDWVIVERGWLDTDHQRGRRSRGWMRTFAGYNSAIWVRRGERGLASRNAFATYYAGLGIPFDLERGFLPRAAERANPEWARGHGVGDHYIRHFLPGGRRSERGVEVSLSAGRPESR